MEAHPSTFLHRDSPSNPLHGAAAQSTVWSFSIKVASVIALVFFASAVGLRAWESFLKWQEKSYRLAMRRRHGIPDTDHRPFNVAHAAVLRARQEHEIKERSRRVAPRIHQVINDASSSKPFPSDIGEQRIVMPGYLDRSPSRPAQPAYTFPSSSLPSNDYAPATTSGVADRHNFSTPIARLSEPLQFPRSRRKRPDLSAIANKRRDYSSDDDDYEPNKVMRVGGRDFPTDDPDSDVLSLAEKISGRNRRGAKRLYDDDEMIEPKRARGKRPRKVSKEYRTEEGEHMMVDEEGDEITALRSLSRGKKRDRTEAGSTFGGEDEDSVTGTDSDEGIKGRQRRKRRTVTKRKSEVYSRGKKRDRDADWQDFDDESSDWPKNRTKREKRYSEDEGYHGSDTSMDASQISQDPLCNGRRIGEVWEVSGVRYKVGSNGERLRQALVKKARSKFVMPQDSQHPDRQAHLEVFVETWLTESRYKEARDEHQLAWQDSPKAPVESKTPDGVPITPSKEGKDLLWSTSRRDSLSKAKPFRQSIATTVGLRVNQFQQPLAGPGRRLTSAFIGDLGGPKLAPRSFSKWEKQDLEAEAMARLRERKRNAEPIKSSVTANMTSSPAPFATASFTGEHQTPSTVNKNTSTISFGVSPANVDMQCVPEPSKAPVQPPISFNTESSSGTGIPSSVPTFSFTPPSATLPVTQTGPFSTPPILGAPVFNTPKVSGTLTTNATSLLAASTTPAPSGTSPASRFAFGVSGTSPSNPASASGQGDPEKKSEQPAEDAKGSTPLLGRLGGFTAPDNSGVVTTSGPTFSFPKSASTGTTAPTNRPVSAFTSTANTATTALKAPTATSANPAPKFDFGFANKGNTTSTTAAAPAPALNATSNSTSAFSFSPTPAQSKPTEPAKSLTPKFNFGVSSSAPAGNNNVSNANQTTTTKPVFSGFGGNQKSATPSLGAPAVSLSTSTPTTSGSVFGGTGWGSVASTTPNQPFVFQHPGNAVTKPIETKPGFSFAPTSTAPSTTEAASTSFPVSASTMPATGEKKRPEVKFNFSATSTSSQTPVFGGQKGKDSGGSVFGKPGLVTTLDVGALSSMDSKQTSLGDPAPTTSIFGAQSTASIEQSTPGKPGSIFGAQPTFSFGAGLLNNAQAMNDTDKSAGETSTPAKPPSNPFIFGAPTASPSFTFGGPPSGQQQR